MRLVAIVLLVSSCADEPETLQHKCGRLRDHVLDLRSEGLPEHDRAAHRKALAQALGEQFVDECKTMTPKQIDCALKSSEIVASAECAATR